jgi:hypothetical protein
LLVLYLNLSVGVLAERVDQALLAQSQIVVQPAPNFHDSNLEFVVMHQSPAARILQEVLSLVVIKNNFMSDVQFKLSTKRSLKLIHGLYFPKLYLQASAM